MDTSRRAKALSSTDGLLKLGGESVSFDLNVGVWGRELCVSCDKRVFARRDGGSAAWAQSWLSGLKGTNDAVRGDLKRPKTALMRGMQQCAAGPQYDTTSNQCKTSNEVAL